MKISKIKDLEKVEEKNEIVENSEKEASNKRKIIWDIVKGIGIISVVIGHVCSIETVHDFVYTYHLIIFFFVAGYFYNEEKYGEKPFENIGHKLKGVWPNFVFYSAIIILLHNLFVRYHFYAPTTLSFTHFSNYIVPILNSIMLNCTELFTGALWFVPVLIVVIGLFGGIVYIARKASNKFDDYKEIIKYTVIVGLSLMYGVVGVYLNKRGLSLSYHIHTAFLVVPICMLGYLLRKNIDKFKKLDKLYIIIPALIISFLFISLIVYKQMKIELSKEMIINLYMFYIVSTVGIIFCISLAAIIKRIPVLRKVIEFCGRHSFAIMSLHFACAKGVDVIYSKIINETDPNVISRLVTTYPEKLWILYVIVGCALPLVFSLVLEKIRKVKLNGRKKDKIINSSSSI